MATHYANKARELAALTEAAGESLKDQVEDEDLDLDGDGEVDSE